MTEPSARRVFRAPALALSACISLTAAEAGWKPIGPAGGAGIDPVLVSGGHILAGTFDGLWRSSDWGSTWTLTQPGIYAYYLHAAGGKLYAPAIGSAAVSLASSDHGAAWQPVPAAEPADTMAWRGIRTSAFIGRYWVVAGVDAIYRSPDSGGTWLRIADRPWRDGYVYQVFRMGASLVAVHEEGYFRSADSGASWQKVSESPRPGFSPRLSALGRFLVGWDLDTLYRTADFGATWQRTYSPYLGSPILTDGRALYAVKAGTPEAMLVRSSDTGRTWQEIAPLDANQGPLSSLAIVGDTLIAGTFAMGVYRSFDGGAHWEQTPLPNLRAVTLAADGKSLWAGTDGGGGLFRLDKEATAWTRPAVSMPENGNVGSIALDGETVFAAGICCELHLSRDGGRSWSDPPARRADLNSIDAVAAKDGALLLAAGECVYRYPSGASQWECVLPKPRPRSGSAPGFLVTQSAVFFGDSSGIFRSRDAGAHWDTLNHGTSGEVHLLAEGDGAIYAGGAQGFFRSGDQGGTWTRTNPDPVRFRALAAIDRTLFAGDDNGVYVSLDEGKSWAAANEGLPAPLGISSLAVFGSELFMGTRASVWKRPLAELVSGITGSAGAGPSAARRLDMRIIRTGRGTAVAFDVPAKGRVRLDGFDLSGRHILTLADAVMDPGPAEAVFPGPGLPPGGYILRLRAGLRERTARIAITP